MGFQENQLLIFRTCENFLSNLKVLEATQAKYMTIKLIGVNITNTPLLQAQE